MKGQRPRVVLGWGVPSPCISVCQIDQESGLCAGCLRTLDEIAAWSLLDDAQKRAVLDAILARRRKSPPAADDHG